MVFADAKSAREFRRALRDKTGETVELRLRALPHPFLIRAQGDDPNALREVITYRDVMPPDGFVPRTILNLGANIGSAIALCAAAFPDATVVGVEPDPDSAELCERNAKPYGAKVICAAAWTDDGTVTINGSSPGVMRISDRGVEVPAVSLDALVDEFGPDFVTMDIEGTERDLLSRNTEWAAKVPCLNIEVHAPYTVEQCAGDLEFLGYDVSFKPAPRAPRVVVTREGVPGPPGASEPTS